MDKYELVAVKKVKNSVALRANLPTNTRRRQKEMPSYRSEKFEFRANIYTY